ncbi:MAG: N-acetylmuramoyl-L-alanine amidase [Clostridia bacterium]|nr:N-acetylmuramoyl-L-alanine amidase [Clostridia bacterium]
MAPIIVIDPGHGGYDPGARGYGLTEKDIVLEVALQTERILQAYAVTVELTRRDDTYVVIPARTARANQMSADLFVSIHVNAGGGTGFESFVYPTAPAKTVELQRQIHGDLARFYARYGFRDRGRKTANFAVLRQTVMSAILVENLFIDHPVDNARLKHPVFRSAIAQILANSMVKAMQLKLKNQVWAPEWEIERLRLAKLVVCLHHPGDTLLWGQYATVLNRVRERSDSGTVWDPEREIGLLVEDRLLASARQPAQVVPWGEFATVLNRLRQRSVEKPGWDPRAEVELLIRDGLLVSVREPGALVNWGEFATVLNRYLYN